MILCHTCLQKCLRYIYESLHECFPVCEFEQCMPFTCPITCEYLFAVWECQQCFCILIVSLRQFLCKFWQSACVLWEGWKVGASVSYGYISSFLVCLLAHSWYWRKYILVDFLSVYLEKEKTWHFYDWQKFMVTPIDFSTLFIPLCPKKRTWHTSECNLNGKTHSMPWFLVNSKTYALAWANEIPI